MPPRHSGDWYTSLHKLWHPKNPFQDLFFQLHFNKKYVEVAINDFTMHLVVSKWLRRQKCRQKDVKMKEKIVYQNVFIYLNTY